MFEVINLGCVRGERRLFRGLNFSCRPGELIEIRGANGSGKTSLLRILCGLAQPAEGEVHWQGNNIRSLGEEYFGSVAYVAHQNGVKDELTAIENLRIASGVSSSRLGEQEAREILARIGLHEESYLPSRLLSAGQRRRVALARLLVTQAELWILDEVLTSLDTAAMDFSARFIGEHLAGGGIAIIATHQDLNISATATQRLEIDSSVS
jgi:heme exporter protein A